MIVQEGPCGYLPGRTWQLEVRLAPLQDAEYRAMLETRHRRSGRIAYRPVCASCSECVPIRVPVARFQPTRSQRRAQRRNQDVRLEVGPLEPTEEKLRLHDKFVRARFDRGEGFGTLDRYAETFGASPVTTAEMRYRVGGRLVGLGIVDLLPDVVSSVYFFFDPDEPRRSLGTHSALEEIELARRTGRSFLYLGYYIAGCREMNYKARFRPCELMDANGRWVEMQDAPPAEDAA